MMRFRLLAALVLLPLALSAADRPLQVDRSRSYVDVDVGLTLGHFTAHLDAYDTAITADAKGKIKTAVFTFKFADLKTGNTDRDEKMIYWIGGTAPEGKFELGILALAPDGQGQVTGRLTIHGVTGRIEFAVNIIQADGTYTITAEPVIDYRNWDLKVIKIAHMIKVDPVLKVRLKLVASLPATPVEP